MDAQLNFRRFNDGSLKLDYTEEAKQIGRENRGKSFPNCLPPSTIRIKAVEEVRKQGGDVDNELLVLGYHRIQFGAYHGQTFRWMLENGLGYSAWFVSSMRGEMPSTAPLSANKFKFKRYLESFQEGREAVKRKTAERMLVHRKPKITPAPSTSSPLMLGHRSLSSRAMKTKFNPKVTPDEELKDDELVSEIMELESSQPSTSTVSSVSSPVLAVPGTSTSVPDVKQPEVPLLQSVGQGYPLPSGWKKTLPEANHQWISNALFKFSSGGKLELNHAKINKLWWYPPQPAVVSNQPPTVNRYFTQRLLLWMPRKMWCVKLLCPQSSCDKKELTSAGIYPRVRQVLDLDSYYSLATEYLECSNCQKKVISWSSAITKQLDIGHRLQLPVVLTYKYACDVRVIRMLRQRGLGNSSTQLQKKLVEQHSESWLQRTCHYLTDCKAFVDANKKKLVLVPSFVEPPAPVPVPTYQWLLTVYCQDVLLRLEELKASITSTFGQVLKMDSTKKVVKKLAGHGAGTASWVTNVGNEHGQVLMSVLTSSEGYGLVPMASGIVARYQQAGVPSPKLLYVDRGCCGHESQLRTMFAGWPNLCIRLDIWHFMRRFAKGCTTDAHQLYGVFMCRLSQCIFEWSGEDLEALKKAKRSELVMRHINNPSEADVIKCITKRELSAHCRRKTRGVEQTTRLLAELLEAFDGDQGLDTIGVPLLDKARIWEIWESQKPHVACIQDPEDVELFMQTGTLVKGGILLPVYRCARGSTSLESFHLHLNRFIPGTSANDLHFQAYLLEGLVRWNEDRASAAVTGGAPEPQSYNCLLRQAVNQLADSVLGKKFNPSFREPRKYTGELIGVEYLFSQTGEVLQDFRPDQDSPEVDQNEPADMEEGIDEGFEDIEDQTVATVEDILQARTRTSLEPSSPSPSHSPVPSDHETAPVPSDHETAPAMSDSAPISTDESVGSDNIEGFGKVESLARYLVSLRDASRALTHEQAAKIVTLWNDLNEYDKRPTKFTPRHRTTQTKGRFKTSKTSSVFPGVDSTKRCFLGQNTGPAQWPDCNRYVEAIIINLCSLYPAPTRSQHVTTLRWTAVMRAYKNIREMVLSNAKVMAQTRIQLVEINNTTLNQWFNKRGKKQEREILEHGITLTLPTATATKPLPTAKTLPSALPLPLKPNPYIFVLPPNTAGQSYVRRATSATATCSEVPPTTRWYRKRQLEKKEKGEFARKYLRKTNITICRKCGLERMKENHTQFYGNWFCQATASITHEEWKAELVSKGYGYGKKK